VKYSDINNRYSGKILILKQNNSKKIFILNPLGRIYFKLILNGENTTAIYVKKKKYWTGDFNEFIRKIWGISIGFDTLYKFIVFGQAPDNKNNAYSAKIKTINDEDGKPEIIEIKKNNIYLRFKIIKNEMKKGKINFKTDMNKFHKTELNKLFEKS
jgi:outer membrane biogenesis lipoprotein LolB